MNAQQVWPYLKSKERPDVEQSRHHPELLSTITLQKGQHWFFGSSIGLNLFVRHSQQQIPDAVMSRFKEMQSLDSVSSDETHGFIIKGTPGIGKSVGVFCCAFAL